MMILASLVFGIKLYKLNSLHLRRYELGKLWTCLQMLSLLDTGGYTRSNTMLMAQLRDSKLGYFPKDITRLKDLIILKHNL